jgi:hypothetical protein
MTTVAPKDLFLPLATYNVRKYEGSCCNCSLVISLSIYTLSLSLYIYIELDILGNICL